MTQADGTRLSRIEVCITLQFLLLIVPHGGLGRGFCPSGRIGPQKLLLIVEGDGRGGGSTEQVVSWVQFPVGAGFAKGQSIAKTIAGLEPLLS